MSDSQVAFVFPGQGSQKVGMLQDAHDKFAPVKETFEEASQALGYDMWALIQEGPQESLNLTATTQPVLLTSSVALWRAWCSVSDLRPKVMAGHSLGEFSALVCAGTLQFSDAVKLVQKRGEFMQSAVPVGVGAMAAIIGLDDAEINRICEQVSASSGEVVAAVNFNSPGQVVVAGHAGAVDKAIEQLKEAGAKRAMPLPVSAPFHTELMRPAGVQLAEEVAALDFSEPTIPVVQNVHAGIEQGPARISELLVEQIYSPVRWTSCVQKMVELGVSQIVECGPGKVLSGLNRRIDKGLESMALEAPDDLEAAAAKLS
jgi:[acyl-carrier-protein] S-malonyltransferase